MLGSCNHIFARALSTPHLSLLLSVPSQPNHNRLYVLAGQAWVFRGGGAYARAMRPQRVMDLHEDIAHCKARPWNVRPPYCGEVLTLPENEYRVVSFAVPVFEGQQQYRTSGFNATVTPTSS